MKKLKKLLVLTMAMMIAVCAYQPLAVRADSIEDGMTWEERDAWRAFINQPISAGPWNVAEGVTAYVKAGILYVEGEGAIPDYDRQALAARPWHYEKFDAIWIDDGITEIGSNAFWGRNTVYSVRIPSTIFIKDPNCFYGIKADSIVRISGNTVATKMIGNIEYTSAMSIINWFQDQKSYRVSVDFNEDAKRLFKTQNYPYLENVFYCTEHKEVTDNPGYVDIHFKRSTLPICKWTTGQQDGYSLKCEKYVPGYYTLLHFSNFIGDYHYGAAFKMWTINPKAQHSNETLTPCTYQLDVPNGLIYPGRTFKLICVMDSAGTTVVLDDLDANDATFTFQSDSIPYQCALIYQDPVVAQ